MESICLSWTREPTKCWLCFDLVIECSQKKKVFGINFISKPFIQGLVSQVEREGLPVNQCLEWNFFVQQSMFFFVWCNELVVLCIGTCSLRATEIMGWSGIESMWNTIQYVGRVEWYVGNIIHTAVILVILSLYLFEHPQEKLMIN